MRSRRIKELTDTSSINSLFQWITLLNFVSDNPDLTIEELRQLADASEIHRQYWNKDKKNITIRNGEKIAQTRPGLGIAQEDVVPNIQRRIEDLSRREPIKPKQHNIESMPLQVAVA
jgi:adenylosuccinate synthase